MDRQGSLYGIICVILWCFIPSEAKFIRFKPGYEYEYKFESNAELTDYGNFNIKAKISFTNIDEKYGYQEILLRIYSFTFYAKDPDTPGHDMDLSKWFSFEITPEGKILRVYHPEESDDFVLASKKGFAALLSSRLHEEGEISGSSSHDGFTYQTQELGHEGPHNATYTVKQTSTGLQFTKVRHEALVKNAGGKYKKVMHYHKDLEVIHSVLIEEDFISPTRPSGKFDALHGMRKIKAVNEFSSMEFPDMKAISKGSLSYLTRRFERDAVTKPMLGLEESTIHVTKMTRKMPMLDRAKAWQYIKGNITCMWTQPENGRTLEANACFFKIVDVLKAIPEEELTKLANYYFVELKSDRSRYVGAMNIMLDAFGVIYTNFSENLLADYILKSPDPKPTLILRLLTHIVGKDNPPHDNMIAAMEDLVFNKDNHPEEMYKEDLHERVLLCLGSVSHKLTKAGREEEAIKITVRVHQWLGIHDPFEYRKKRAIQSEQEQIDYDHWRVILLETLGNARMDFSFEYIVSHINSTNSPWIKRAGVHALRKYEHEMAADEMYKAAMYDENDEVRYEALLQYQAHPQARIITPLKAREEVNGTGIIDPYESGITEIAPQRREKRSLGFLEKFPKIDFRLEAPSVDWRKMLGSESIGAAFGIIMYNMLDLKIEPLSGGTQYNLNILQENDMKKIAELATKFDKKVKEIVDAIETGVRLFKDLIGGKISIKDIVNEFIDALKELPGKVWGLRDKAANVMKMLGQLDEEELPPFLRPLRNLIVKVTTVFNDVKTDIMNFYNTLVQTITVIIPQNAKLIYESIVDIIDGFKVIMKDPKTALVKIGKGVVQIFMSIKALLDAKNKTQEACFFLKDEKPYWWDIVTVFEEIWALSQQAVKALATGGPNWIATTVIAGEDPVAKFTKGKVSQQQIKEQIIDNLTNIIDELLEPFDDLRGIADKFMKKYGDFFGLVKKVKEAYAILKEGYEFGQSIINTLFGPKCHKDFPRLYRLDAGPCEGEGFYPSKMKKSGQGEYAVDGVDLEIDVGQTLVAPFPGIVYKGDNPDEVIIEANTAALKDIKIYINGVTVNKTILHKTDQLYIENRIAAGAPIGTVKQSPCYPFNSIHFAMKKGNGTVDPTKFLSPRFFEVPKWIQTCDDYKLVYKFETIAAGVIVGLGGQAQNNTSPKLDKSKVIAPAAPAASEDPGSEADTIKSNPDGMYTKTKANANNLPDDSKNGKKGPFATLMAKADSFMKKFSLRRLKMGTIIEFLTKLGMTDSRAKFVQTLKTLQAIIDNKPCFNPHELTDEQIKQTLQERGKPINGTREQMIKRIMDQDNQCPLMAFTLPKKVYCIFSSDCMAVECCMNVKISMFLRVVKAYANFNPCTFKFSYGFDMFKGEIQLPKLDFDGIEKIINTGIVFPIPVIGDLEIVVFLKIEKTDLETVATFGGGLCEPGSYPDEENCLVTINLLDQAVLPLPICYPNGSYSWPDINWATYFSKEAVLERLKQAGKKAAKQLAGNLAEEALAALGLPADLLAATGPCPRPENMTLAILKGKMIDADLNTTGTRLALNSRYELYDRSCYIALFNKTLSLPAITNPTLKKHLYYQMSPNCMRFDACADVTIKAIDYTKALKAYVELDPCKFILYAGFEKWEHTRKEELLEITPEIKVMIKIDRDADVKKVFIVNFGLKICIAGDCVLDEYFITDYEVPIPLCNENFTLPGGGALADFAKTLGGAITAEAFDLILRMLKLDTIFQKGSCTVPPGPTDCPWNIDVKSYLPTSVKHLVTCEMPDNCFGLDCCIDVKFTLPPALGGRVIAYSVPFWFKMSPCDFTIDVGFGTWTYKKTLFEYAWGKIFTAFFEYAWGKTFTAFFEYAWGTQKELTIGDGDPAPVKILYTISKMGGGEGFIIDTIVTICIPFDDNEPFCAPTPDGFHLLKSQQVPLCSRNLTNILSNISFSQIAKDVGYEAGQQLAQGAVQYLLEQVGLTDFFKTKCDRKRGIYDPSVVGWNNMCPLSISKLPEIDGPMTCMITETCSGIDCCAEIPFIGLTVHPYFLINTCEYSISFGINNMGVNLSLFEGGIDSYEWGKPWTLNIEDIVKITLIMKKPPNEKKFIVDLSASVCFDESEPEQCLTFPMMVGSEIPQPFCDMTATMSLSNFSAIDWGAQLGINLTDFTGILAKNVAQLLLQQLGLDDMMDDPGCSRTADVYQPSEYGWKNTCPLDIVSPPNITVPMNCYIPDYCTGLDCCFHYDYLDISLHAYLYIDTCSYIIRGGIEKLSFEYKILDFGDLWEYSFDRFTIDQLLFEKKLIVDMSMSICLDVNTDCQFNFDILVQQKFPQPLCDLDMSGWTGDTNSLVDWVKDKGLEAGQSLSTALANKLFDDFGLTQFLYNPSCDRFDGIYAGAVDGWKADACPKSSDMTLPKIRGTVSCYVPDYCTGIDCCVDVGKIGKSFRIYALLDACNWKLSIGIEKRAFNFTIIDYKWGEKKTMSILQVLKMEYTIHDLQAEKKYMLNMNLSVCFEETGPCLVSVPVFENTKLPKLGCDWTQTSLDFSLSDFKAQNSITGAVTGLIRDKMLEALGLTPYLKDPTCSRTAAPFAGAVDGWTNGMYTF
ncbi:Hypothetical predicted protein [Mytilus galloprovincialis]|uniref:SAP domain-containing protein n=1 Tax=Mytilus galloprovincialis TaxID=29158 RepID=A0A8B6BJ17_MYTGA|nr:Hypothetical predicted protein [Mytilus galloprovincialis]